MCCTHKLLCWPLNRTTLILMLITATGGVWLLEQPISSVLFQSDRMQWFLVQLRKFRVKIFRQSFWMAHYAHKNYKLTKVWSLSWGIWRLDFGRLNRKKVKRSAATTRRYQNSKGEERFSGGAELKTSQLLGCNNLNSFLSVWKGCN